MTYDEKIIKLAEIIKNSKKTVFFGGAGVSTESGLKDYRSETGIYKTVKSYGVSPETILSHTFFLDNPRTFYKFYRDFFIGDVKPNKAHIALAKLERAGLLSSVITQNVDNLHQAAGSRNVLELHGTAEKYFCMRCKEKYTKEIFDTDWDDEPQPQTGFTIKNGVPHCHCGGIIRPVVTLYEEALDDDVTSRAIGEIYTADTLIVGGTSLAVYPAAAYLGYFKGSNIVVINKQETPVDSKANLVFYDSIGKVLSDVCKHV